MRVAVSRRSAGSEGTVSWPDINGMSDPITIRTDLRPGDLTYVLASHQAHYHRTYGYTAAFEYRIARALAESYAAGGQSRWWFAERGERRVGSLFLMDRGEGLAQLRFFYVAEDCRGMGLGRRLLDYFTRHLRAAAAKKCYLWTTTEQTAARRLYEATGFRETERLASADFGVPQTNLRYELTVDQ